MWTLGLDIGGTAVKAAMVLTAPSGSTAPAPVQAMPGAATPQGGALVGGLAAGLVATSDRYTRPDRSSLIRALQQAAGTLAHPDRRVSAIGLCAPGRRDEAGTTVLASVNVPGLVGQPLEALVREALGRPVPLTFISSDAHAAAVDLAFALSANPGAHPRRLLAISLGTGVGACVLDGLTPLCVSGASPGHLGQIDVSVPLDDGTIPTGPDGGRGGLEAYIGLPALVARLGPPAETVLDRVRPGDPAMAALARAIRIAHAIYRPQIVALLGGVGARLRPHAGMIRQHIDAGLTSIARPDWELVFGTDDHHAARGAARLAGACIGSGAA